MLKDKIQTLGDLDEIAQLDTQAVTKLYKKHLNPVLTQISRFLGANIQFKKAIDCYLFDSKGNRYIDFLSGFGALNLGHENEKVLNALKIAEGRPNFFQSHLNPFAAKLGEYLSVVTPGDLNRSFFCCTGTEAVEAALKLARKASGKKRFIYARGAYHGKTYGALSVSGRDKYKEPFAPLLPGTASVPYDDVDALENELKSEDVAGFIVEPIQGENGVVVPSEGYLRRVSEICKKYHTLLLLDEVQTGFGRTGTLFACEYEGVTPDILILSKSLSGGVIPIGAIITTDSLWKKAYGSLDSGLLHSTTFGGNSKACACAIAAIREIILLDLPQRAKDLGAYFKERLVEMSKTSMLIREVRGRGLMLGIGFHPLKGNQKLLEGGLTLWIARQMFKKHKIITAFTLNNLDVLRLAPPLTIEKKDIDIFLDALAIELKRAEKISQFGLLKKEG